jgi:hypothetical protein
MPRTRRTPYASLLRLVLGVIVALGVAGGLLALLAPMAHASGDAASSATDVWTVQSTPSRSGAADLNAVWCTSSSACVAVGGSQSVFGPRVGTTLTEVWNGRSWIESSSSLGSLSGVSCWASNGCMAVGATDHNEPLAQIWNGSSWRTLKTPKTSTGGGYFEAVSCWDKNGCIAVGYDWHKTRASKALAEAWNGREWKLLRTPPIAGSDLQGLSCWSGSGCVAVGHDYHPTDAGLAEIWNGHLWKAQMTPSLSDDVTSAVSCWQLGRCMAIGSGTVRHKGRVTTTRPIAEVWNGRSWEIEGRIPSDVGLTAVSCLSESDCVAVGQGPWPYQPTAALWNGESWQSSPTPKEPDYGLLNGVSCWSSTECMAVGVHDLGADTNQPLAETLG